MHERGKLQEEYKKAWIPVHRYNRDNNTQLELIGKRIGEKTHQLNQLISELCRCKKTHRAMNLASEFIDSEIKRIKNNIRETQDKIHWAKSGGMLRTGDAQLTRDTKPLLHYLDNKNRQLQRLHDWKNHVNKYME